VSAPNTAEIAATSDTGSARVRVGDIELHYERYGSGEPVLLLHGLGSSILDWEPQITALSQQYQVVAVDFRGHGQSDKPAGPYSIPGFAEDIANLISQLGLGPMHVVGISMGGMVAFQLAVDAPEQVRSLVIINSGPEFPSHTLKAKLVIQSRLLMLKFMGMRRLGTAIAKRLFPAPEHKSLRHLFVDRFSSNDPRAYESSVRAIARFSLADRLDQIRCPVLVVSSDRDYTPVSAKQAYLPQLASAKLIVIRNAGHACTLDQPDQVNTSLLDFLHSQRGTSH
jgi:3-oxoadipate enol-lactonase